jgi:hypothetical protein
MNAAEFVFNYIRTLMRQQYSEMALLNLEYAVIQILDTLTAAEMHGFYTKLEYLNM